MYYSHTFLVIRLSSMGDVLLSTAFLRQLRATYPHARIDVLVDERFAEVLRYNPHCSTVVEYSRSMVGEEVAGLRQSLRISLPQGKYDAVIDLQGNHRSRGLRRGMGRRVYRIHKARWKKLAIVYLKKNLYATTVPIAERYRATACGLDVDDDGKGLELWLPEESSLAVYPPAVRTLSNTCTRIAVAPGAFHATKRWLPERFAEAASTLAQETGAEIVLLGGSADQHICATVATYIPKGISVINASGKTSISETAQILDSCNLLLTNDTGVMHIAAARGVPVVSVFGSTVQEFGFAPFRVPARVVEADVPCRPCTHIGRSHCPKHHFHCMRFVETTHVVEAAHALLQQFPPL